MTTDNIYTGSAEGNQGKIDVSVKIQNNKIIEITVLGHNETAGVSDPAFQKIINEIIEQQSVNVDAISGATITSNSIKNAVKEAVNKIENYSGEFEGEIDQNDVKDFTFKTNDYKKMDEGSLEWDKSADVVIVGAGAAGLSAAVEAARANDGVSVLVLEFAGNHLSSNSALCGGVYYSGDTSLHKEAGIEDSKEEWRKYVDVVGGGFEDSEIMDAWIEEAPENLDWLIDMGVDFPLDLMYMSGNELSLSDVTKPVPRGFVTKEQTGASISEALYQEAKKLGVEFAFSTIAEKLVTNEKGQVCGVITDKGAFKANKGVVIASAGFSRNKEWIKSFKPELSTGGSFGSTRQQGDGIKMGMDIGAKIGNMWITQADTIGTQTSENMWPCMVIAIWEQPCVFVDANGKRQMAEDMYYEYQSKEIAKQEGGFVWSIWDQSVTDLGGQTVTVPASSDGCVREVEEGYFKKADTIEELAKQMAINPATLVETVEHYNGMMRDGEDKDFGRATGLAEVKNGPFYAAKTVPATCDTAGGLIINKDAQVLDHWDNPIPGLYAAGSTTSGWRGEIYPGSGTAISIAVTFGRKAGNNITK